MLDLKLITRGWIVQESDESSRETGRQVGYGTEASSRKAVLEASSLATLL